jgi:hypothetical protein
LVNPIRDELQLASQKNKDDMRQSLHQLVSNGFHLLKAIKEANVTGWTSLCREFRNSLLQVEQCMRETSADFLIDNL